MYSGIALLLGFLLVYEVVSLSSAIVCPKDFQCGNFGNLSFPFTDYAHLDCGLCMTDCSLQTFPQVFLGQNTNRWYKLLTIDSHGNSIRVFDAEFQDDLKHHMCTSFINPINQEYSEAISFTVEPNITVIKCATETLGNMGIKPFNGLLRNYTTCRDFIIYYTNPKEDDNPHPLNNIGTLPSNCQRITLPMAPDDSITKNSGFFELFTAEFDLTWHLSDNCVRCLSGSKGSLCHGDNVRCANNAGKPVSKGVNKIAPYVGASIGGGVITIIICIILVKIIIKKSKDNIEGDFSDILLGTPSKYSYEELKAATENFRTKLGKGGFGSVYKGTLSNGIDIAVKCLHNVGKGKEDESFLAEVRSIGSVHHYNLVKLIGFCTDKSHRLLVYEFMINGSLDRWIYGKKKDLDVNNNEDNVISLQWQTRKKIIVDIAKGLAYLHEECSQKIIHLDIKPQNILLDKDFNAKVSDFGLAKLIEKDQSKTVTKMRGTPGYLAPEWLSSAITEKTDVYSFGVVTLEIICGRKNLDCSRTEVEKHLLSFYTEKAKEKDGLWELVDKTCEDIENHRNEAEEMMKIAAWCLQTDFTKRPSMSLVVKVLEGLVPVETNLDLDLTNLSTFGTVAISNRYPKANESLVLPSLLSAPR